MVDIASTSAEIRQRIVARIIASSGLTDIAEGGVYATIIGAVSDELAMLTHRNLIMRQAHHFSDMLNDVDADDRVAQLPEPFPRRKQEEAASGGAIYLVRSSTVDAITIPAGKLELGRSDQPNITYTNDAEVFLDVGQAIFPGVGQDPVGLVCGTVGMSGNAPAGAVNVLISYADTFTAAVNTGSVGGGYAREDTPALLRRARLWLSSLARSNAAGLESLAKSFRSSDGKTVLYAKCIDDPNRIGYSRLIIDDGFGMQGFKRNASPRTTTGPTLAAGQRYSIPFDYPAVTSPPLKVTRSGTTRTYLPGPNMDWLPIEERGILWTNPVLRTLDLQPGDEVEVSGYQVFKGLPAELQAEVEANGRAAGTRVRVELARPVYVSLSGVVLALPGYDLAELITNIKTAIVLYGATIEPGAPLYFHRLHAYLRRAVPGIDNIKFDQTDKQPGDPVNRIAFLPGLMTFR